MSKYYTRSDLDGSTVYEVKPTGSGFLVSGVFWSNKEFSEDFREATEAEVEACLTRRYGVSKRAESLDRLFETGQQIENEYAKES